MFCWFYTLWTKRKVYFRQQALGVTVATVIETCIGSAASLYLCVCACTFAPMQICVYPKVSVWPLFNFNFVCLSRGVLLCRMHNCNPQQTGTKISALWAVWLKVFMICHCEPSPKPYNLFCNKCHAVLCVVARPCMSLWSECLHLNSALFHPHSKIMTQCSSIFYITWQVPFLMTN